MPEGLLPKGSVFWGGALIVALLLPFVNGGEAFLGACTLFAMYASINVMWSLVLGTAGILSFATLAIVGASAYAAAYISLHQGAAWPVMLVIGAVVGGVVGVIVAVPAIRLRGVYFALLTFGLVQLFASYATVTDSLGGARGLYGASSFVPDSDSLVGAAAKIGYYAGLVMLIVALVVHAVVGNGRLGKILRTARESEPFAQALGIDVVRARMVVFLVSSTMLGVVGAFYASYYRGVSPSIFDFSTLLLLFAMMIVGGIGSARGVLIGTGVLLFIDQHWLESGPARLIAAALLMYVVTMLTTDGLYGLPKQLRDWDAARRARGAGREAAATPVDLVHEDAAASLAVSQSKEAPK